MKDLFTQYQLLQQQLNDLYTMITNEVSSFKIDDYNYANGDAKCEVWQGYEGEWQIVTDNGCISGFSGDGNVIIWEQVWRILHGMPVIYDHQQPVEEMNELDPRDRHSYNDYGDLNS